MSGGRPVSQGVCPSLTLVDPCILSGAEDGQVFIEGERLGERLGRWRGGGGVNEILFYYRMNSNNVREEMLKRNLPDKEQLLHKNSMNDCINSVFDFLTSGRTRTIQ